VRIRQRSWDEIESEQTLRVNRTRHDELAFRDLLEADPRIIGLIANQDNQPMTQGFG